MLDINTKQQSRVLTNAFNIFISLHCLMLSAQYNVLIAVSLYVLKLYFLKLTFRLTENNIVVG